MTIKGRLILALISLLFYTGSVSVAAYKGYQWGHVEATARCDTEKSTATKNKIDVKEKQNEIRNNRPDVVRVVSRLRSHTF